MSTRNSCLKRKQTLFWKRRNSGVEKGTMSGQRIRNAGKRGMRSSGIVASVVSVSLKSDMNDVSLTNDTSIDMSRDTIDAALHAVELMSTVAANEVEVAVKTLGSHITQNMSREKPETVSF